MRSLHDHRGFLSAVVGDGRPLLAVTALGLVLAGLFGLFLAVAGEFLPHDERFLGMTATDLCALHGCRVVHFMIHDRASLGGALVALGLLYLWLVQFPLTHGQCWAWWLFLITGIVGYASFFAYLGYGYLDRWHAAASVLLLACHALGLARSWSALRAQESVRCLLRAGHPTSWRSQAGAGRACLLLAAAGIAGGGLTILGVGMTCVFIPEDVQYLGLSAADLDALNPRLVPLIAHDRASFGGVLCCYGTVMGFCVWCGPPSRSLWQALGLAGVAAFGTAIGVHPAIGYVDAVHLGPAVLGAAFYLAGLILTQRGMVAGPGGRRDMIAVNEVEIDNDRRA